VSDKAEYFTDYNLNEIYFPL